jgi:hypothetical protein
MARIRTIKPDFWESPHQRDMNMAQRCLFLGLLTQVDDAGRWRAEPQLIAGRIFPYDDIDLDALDSDLRHLADIGLIYLYEVAGRPFLWIRHFTDHQTINRPTPARWPDPEGPDARPLTRGNAETHGGLTEDSLRTHGALTEDSVMEREREGEGERERENTSSSTETNVDADDVEPLAAVLTLLPAEVEVVTTGSKYPEDFEAFWELFPRKVGKGEAFRHWRNMREADKVAAINAIHRQLDHWERQQRERQFIPHPATWLRQARYDDDPTTDVREATPSKKPQGWGALEKINRRIQLEKNGLPL